VKGMSMGKLRKQLEKVRGTNGITGPYIRDLHDLLEEIVNRLEPETPPKGSAPQGINRIRQDRDRPQE